MLLPYYVLLLVVVWVLNSSLSKKKSLSFFSFPFIFSGILLVLFAGLRSSEVGTDTNNYVGIYNNFSYYTDSIFEIESTIEIGYWILQKVALFFSSEYYALLIAIAFLSVFPMLYVLKKFSKNVTLSVFIYITIASYLVFFNAGRQGIAIGISSLSLIFLLKRNMIAYFMCIAFASLFHNTALIMLPFYFILNREVKLKNILIYLFLGGGSISFLGYLLSVFSTDVEARYAVYENRGATGGYLLALFFNLTTVILFNFRKRITKENLNRYDIYLNYSLFVSIIYLLVVFTGIDVNFMRLSNYFMLGYILIWPLVFEDVKYFKNHAIKLMFVLVHLLFYGIYLYKMSNLVPYSLNPNL
ncbi:EpsG family protein [Robertkochia flava]|uniref:EpsG family protein n=1 Tax=Robertkochia flava TaxID=3447986 RepID=UPI001CCD81EF|nr:EpsG family protein [Robertkochia marina]